VKKMGKTPYQIHVRKGTSEKKDIEGNSYSNEKKTAGLKAK
jgi:hypothetical protein